MCNMNLYCLLVFVLYCYQVLFFLVVLWNAFIYEAGDVHGCVEGEKCHRQVIDSYLPCFSPPVPIVYRYEVPANKRK